MMEWCFVKDCATYQYICNQYKYNLQVSSMKELFKETRLHKTATFLMQIHNKWNNLEKLQQPSLLAPLLVPWTGGLADIIKTLPFLFISSDYPQNTSKILSGDYRFCIQEQGNKCYFSIVLYRPKELHEWEGQLLVTKEKEVQVLIEMDSSKRLLKS